MADTLPQNILPPPAGQPTAQQVADAAGVSISAVSRVFTPGASVSARMRARVLEAAARLDYVPNVLARSLMTQRTHLVGLILSNFHSPIYLGVLDDFTRKLQAQGLRVLLLNVSGAGGPDDMARLVMQYNVDGLIVAAGAVSPAIAGQCQRRRIALVGFARHPGGVDMDVVSADNEAGGALAGQALLAAGHRRIGYLGGPPGTSTSRARGQGLARALAGAGVVPLVAHAAAYSYEAGMIAARALMGGPDRPGALFCASDTLAMAALDVARSELGLSVPRDLSVIGFDDIPMARASAYELTTIRQPLSQMVDQTIACLTARIQDWSTPRQTQLLPCDLITRGTLGPPAP